MAEVMHMVDENDVLDDLLVLFYGMGMLIGDELMLKCTMHDCDIDLTNTSGIHHGLYVC